MLCAIRQRDNKKALAPDESKSNSPFVCPRCAAEVILKKGSVKTHHFAHWPPVLCEYGQGETEEHRKCKLAIYEGCADRERSRDSEAGR
jgi:competence protein CoiA